MSLARILLIEDATGQRADAQQSTLEELSYCCESVTSLTGAREKIAVQNFDAVVLNTEVAEIEVAEININALLPDLNQRSIPLVVLAAAGAEDTVIHLMQQGASGFLIKDQALSYLKLLPITLAQVIAAAQLKQQLANTTEQQEPEKQLLRTVIDAVPNKIFVKDGDGHYLLANREMVNFYGTTVNDLLGKQDTDFHLDAAVCQKFVQENRRVIETRQELLIPEEQSLDAQGEEHWWQWHKLPIQLPGHSDTAVLGVGTDITQRKQTLQKVAFQASLLDQVHNAVIATDLNGQITYWNHYAEILYQWTAEEVLGMHFVEVLAPAPTGQATGIWKQLQSQEHWEGEFEVYRKDGTTLPIQISNTLAFNQQGEPIGSITVSTDISDRRRSEVERDRQALLLERQRRVLELLILDTPLPEILNFIVQTIEAQQEGLIGSILLLEGNHLWHGAAPSLPEAYVQATNGIEIGPQVGSCGTAAYRKEPIVVTEIATDPLWENGRDLALRHGLQACWSVPIFAKSGAILGTFALYHREPYAPGAEDWKLVNMAIYLSALAIERRQTELALIQGENRLRETFENAAVGICHVDLEGHLLRFNQRFCEISGYSAQELQSLTFQEITYPDDLPIDLLQFQRLLNGSLSTYTLEKRYICKDRSVIWTNLTVSLVRDEAGNPSYLISIVEDITDRKQAEFELRRSEMRYATLAAAVPVGIFRTDRTGHCLYVNDRWCQIAGLKPEQALGMGWLQGIHPDDRASMLAEWKHATQTQQPFRLEYRFQRPDGTVSWVFGQAVAEFTVNDNITGYVGTITDITERKLVEDKRQQAEAALQRLNQELEIRVEERTEELQQSNQKLQRAITEQQKLVALVENSQDFIAIATPGECMTYLNRAGRQLVGLDETAEITNYVISDFHFPEDWPELQEHMLEALLRGDSWQGEVRLRHFQTQAAIPMLHSAFPIKHPQTGELMAIAGILRDISQQKQTENALYESQRFLQLVLDTIPQAVFWKDLNSHYLGSNRIFLQNAGLASVADLVGKSDIDLPWGQTEAAAYRAHDQWVINHNDSRLGIIEPLTQINGDQIWAETNKLPLHNHRGEVIGVLGTYQDITQRMQSEQQLRHLSERLHLALQSAPIGIWEWDIEQNIKIWDDQMCKLYGMDISQIDDFYQVWLDSIHPVDRPVIHDAIQRALRGEQDYDTEFRVIRPDGTIQHIKAYGVVQRNEQGTAKRMVGMNIDISERKQAEKQIRDLSERLSLAITSAKMGIWEWHISTNQVIWDDQMYALYGLQPGEFDNAYEAWLHAVHPDDQAEAELISQQARRGEREYNPEFRVVHADGSIHYIQAYACIERDEHGEPQRMIGINFDITDRKQTELALRESEQRLSTLTEAAPVGIFRFDLDGQCIYVNDRWGEMTGRPLSDGLGLQWLKTIHPDDCEHTVRNVAQWLQTCQPGDLYRGEARILRPDGSIIWYVCQMVPETDVDGKITGYVGTLTDINDLKLVEAALKESEERYRALMDGASDAILLSDTEGRCLGGNRKAEELLGYTREELSHLTIAQLHPPAELEHYVAEFSKMAQSGSGQALDAHVLRKDGISVPVDITASIIEVNGKSIALSIFRDITERKQAELVVKDSEARFRSYFELSLVGKAITSLEKGWVEVNDKLCEILGYPREELTQLTWTEITHPDDLETDLAHFNQILRGETNGYSLDKRFIRKDGRVIHASISVRCLRKNDGSVDYFIALIQDITARKQAEEQLRRSEFSLLEAQRVAHIGNWNFDIPTQIISWSEELFRMFGLDPTQPAPTFAEFLEKIHPEDRAVLLQCVEAASDQGTPYTIDYRVLLPDGSIRHQEGRGEAIRDQQGNVIQLYGTALDITDRKQIELELQKNRDLREAIFEKSTDALFIVDPKTELIVDCNQRAIEMFEADSKVDLLHINGNTLQRYSFSPDELTTIVQEVETTGFWNRELEYVTRKGKLFWANIAGTTVNLADAPIRFVRLSDITDRKQIELLLNQQLEKEQLLVSILTRIRESLDLTAILQVAVNAVRELIQSDRVLVYQINQDGTGLTVAESVVEPWQHILDTSFPAEAFPPNCYQRYVQGAIYTINDRDTTSIRKCMIQFMQNFQIRAKLVVPIVQQENQKLWGLLIAHQCSGTRHWEGWEIELLQQLAGQLAIAIQQAALYQQAQAELLERQRTETILQSTNEKLQLVNRDLARATRLKDEFLASMSHELRTPLNAVLGMSEALQEGILGQLNQEQQKALKTIEQSGRHLLDLINDILDLAKIEAGKLELNLASYSVEVLCKSTISLVKQMAYQKSIRLNVAVPPNLSSIEIDDRRMRQVLVNLLSNAIKFTPEGGAVTLEVWRQTSTDRALQAPQHAAPSSDTMHFSVTDTGIGIAPKDMPKLFQSFVQIDSSLNRQYSGTGLGLALVKQIVELHNGWVQVESQLGQGSRFTVVLPDHGSSQSSQQQKSLMASNSTHQPLLEVGHDAKPQPLILLVEDNQANIETYSNYLMNYGYRLIVAKNGREAITLAKLNQPDLILMDIQMPEMDGLEASRQIRALPELHHTPIFALTALAMPGDREKCLEAGINEYLTKPIRLRQLVNQISQLLNR